MILLFDGKEKYRTPSFYGISDTSDAGRLPYGCGGKKMHHLQRYTQTYLKDLVQPILGTETRKLFCENTSSENLHPLYRYYATPL